MPVWCRNPDELADAVAQRLPTEHRAAILAHPRWPSAIVEAWAAGWRDAEWLTTYAVAGSALPEVNDPPSWIVYQLLAASDIPFPEWREIPDGDVATEETP